MSDKTKWMIPDPGAGGVVHCERVLDEFTAELALRQW
jgi:hypothetical protein